MTLVPTARGDEIGTTELGVTMMHEHIFVLNPEVNQNYPETWGDEETRVADALVELDEAKAHGVDTIVDLTALGMGRDVRRIKRLAQSTDLNIIVATGYYTWETLPMYFNKQGPGTPNGGPEMLVDMFVRDIEEGIADTGVRAGVLKCATHTKGLTPGVERVLRATAQAHRMTGVPICTHAYVIPNGADQQTVFTEEGVDLTRVVIGHIDDAAGQDLTYVEQILANGSFVSFDRFGRELVTSDQTRVECIAELCRRGHADQIVMSHDHVVYADMSLVNPPRNRYTTVVDHAVPALQELGVSDEDVKKMLVHNPRRIFETRARGAY